MVVVSLFAGMMTNASAAGIGVTVSPAKATIYGTGSADFTVSTVLDSLMDRVGGSDDFNLSDFVGGLKAEGLDLDTLTEMLGGAGFNWDDILGSLTDNGFKIGDIAGSLLDLLDNGDVHLEDILGDLTGNEGALKDLIGALKDQGFSSDMFNRIWDLFSGSDGSGSGLGDLIGRFGRNSSGAKVESLSDDPPEEPSVTNVVASKLIESLTEKYGDLFTKDRQTQLENLLNQAGALDDKLSLSDAVGDIAKIMGNADFDLNLEDITKALLGEGADFSKIIRKLKDFGVSSGDITDMLFGQNITYRWFVRSGTTSKQVSRANDQNTYTGNEERTLTVSRDKAPAQDKTYTYFCSVKVGDTEYISSNAVLTISAETAPTEPTTQPTTQPVLDNVSHVAYIDGYEDGSVQPNAQITRAEVSKILYSLLTEESRSYYYTRVNTFYDVRADEWFIEAVSTLARASVLDGYEDGAFRPYSPITRAELATVLTRMTVLVPPDATGTPVYFPDTAGHWAASNIRIASAKGWIEGYEDGTFHPDSPVTRAEAVTMVNRMLNRNPSVLVNTAGMRTFYDNMDAAAWFYIPIQEAANAHDYTRGGDGTELWLKVNR